MIFTSDVSVFPHSLGCSWAACHSQRCFVVTTLKRLILSHKTPAPNKHNTKTYSYLEKYLYCYYNFFLLFSVSHWNAQFISVTSSVYLWEPLVRCPVTFQHRVLLSLVDLVNKYSFSIICTFLCDIFILFAKYLLSLFPNSSSSFSIASEMPLQFIFIFFYYLCLLFWCFPEISVSMLISSLLH